MHNFAKTLNIHINTVNTLIRGFIFAIFHEFSFILTLTSYFLFLLAKYDIRYTIIIPGNGDHDTFRLVEAPRNELETLPGFKWLALNDDFLNQWHKFCLPRRVRHDENHGEHTLLSTYMLKDAIKVRY